MVFNGFQKIFKTEIPNEIMSATNDAKLIANAPIVSIHIEKLKHDPENVRLKHLKSKPSQTKIQQVLREVGNTSELKHQILAEGVVYEPLVVNYENTVLEGNRRLVALKDIMRDIEQNKLQGYDILKLKKVKCRKLAKNVSKKAIDIYLATIHVRAKKPWKLFNRAKHIFQLSKVHHLSYNDIAARVGMAKSTIQRAIICYQLVLDYSNRYIDDKEWFNKYSYFEELFKRKDLVDFREHENNLTKFAKWVHDKKFHDYQDLRKLNLVMLDGTAYEEFEKHNFDAALRALEKNDPSISDKDFKGIKNTIEICRNLSRTELIDIKSNPSKMRMIYQLEAELKSLVSDLENIKERKQLQTERN